METTIYTIGHGAGRFGDLVEIARAHGIATVVDVRSRPYSRHAPDFIRADLEQSCSAAGIGYRWMGDALGGRHDDATPLDSGGGAGPPELHPGFGAALDTVIAMSRGGRVVLLCGEESPDRCHRGMLLAPALVERGHHVVHLLADGTAVPHQDPLDLG